MDCHSVFCVLAVMLAGCDGITLEDKPYEEPSPYDTAGSQGLTP